MSSSAIPNSNTLSPTILRESMNINYREVSASAVKHIWGYLTSPQSKGLKVLKVTLGVPIFLAITVAAIAITAIVFLSYCVAMPCGVVRPWSRRTISNYINASVREVAAVFFAILMYPVNISRLNPTHLPVAPLKKITIDSAKSPNPMPSKVQSKKPTIVFINGYAHNSSAWFYHLDKVREETGANVFTVSLIGPCKSLEQHAEHLKSELEKISKITGQSEVFLVGHSMGGDVSLLYATKYAKKDTVKTVVTLGSPIGGTVMAKLAVGKSARQMERNSPFTKELAGLIQQSDIPFVHMGSTVDMVIRPAASAFSQNLKATLIEFDDTSHAGYLISNTVSKRIVEAHRRVDPSI